MKISLVKPMSLAVLLLSAYSSYAVTPASGPVVPDAQEGDTATFVGRTDNAVRYLRLGKLALENGDVPTAVTFLQQAMTGLSDEQAQCHAVDLLHAALLAGGRVADAEKLLAEATASGKYAERREYLLLMQGRTLFFAGEYTQSAGIFRKLADNGAPSSYTTMQALELLGKTLHELKDFQQSRSVYNLLAAQSPLAGDSGMWLLKACEGIIFNSLELNELEPAQAAFQKLRAEVPQDLQQEFSDRIDRIDWLLQSFDSNTSEMEKHFQSAIESLQHPDALLARIALRLSDNYRALKKIELALHYSTLCFDMAEKAFRQTALRNLIEVQTSAGKLNDALKDIDLYLQEFPQASDHSNMLLLAGNICVKLDDNASALKYYHRVADNADETPANRYQASVELAKIYRKTARQTEAVDHFNLAIQLAPGANERQMLQQQLGEYLYQLGRYMDAAEEFEHVADAGSSRGALWLAQSYYQLKSYQRAMAALQRFADYGDKALQLKADYLRALLTEKISSADNAIKLYLEFAARYPDQPEGADALFQAGVLAMGSEKYQPAEIFRKFAASYPGERGANALYKAFNIYLADNDEKSAAEIFTQLSDDYPENKYTFSSYLVMSNFLRQNSRALEALALLEKLHTTYAEKHPELLPEILFDQALNHHQLQNHQQMSVVLEELTGKYPDHPVAAQGFFLLGDLKMMQSDFTAALNCFQQAQERSGEGVFHLGCTGRLADAAYALYVSNGQKQHLRMAVENYEKLLKSSDLPTELYYQSLYKLGSCRLEMQDQPGALRCYRELLYRAELARRELRYYPAQWCAKALEGAMKLLLPAIRKAPDAEQFATLRNEAERLLKLAGKLEIPGEDTARQLEVLNNIEFNAQ